MDLRKTASEFGLFETAINLCSVKSSQDVIRKAGNSFPLPSDDIRDRTSRAAAMLRSLQKNTYMFLTPDIALIEEMIRQNKDAREMAFIIVIPCDLDGEAKERLRNNLPKHADVRLLEEPYFPDRFFPGNGVIVVCGYMADSRAMILPETYRLVEHYSGFLGRKVFIPYVELEVPSRYEGWMELSQKRLSTEWRYAG